MPSASRKSTSKPAAASSSNKPKSFNFKSMRRDSASSARASSFSSARSAGPRSDKPTTGFARRTKYQEGDNKGEDTNNWLYVFNPAHGVDNEHAKEVVMKHALGGAQISGFKKDLGGFTVRVCAPQQVRDMHAALRELDDKMAEDVDLDGLEAPELTIVTVSNLDLPATKAHPADEHEGVTALMLEGYSYPLYRQLRKFGYDFYRGVHGKDGINRWCRVVKSASDAARAEKETITLLKDHGWDVDTAAGDARDWPEDGEEEDDE